MARNKIIKTLALSTLFLAACSSGQAEDTPEESAEDTNQETEEVVQVDHNEVEKEYRIDPETFSVVPLEGSNADPNVVLLTFDDAPYGNSMDIAQTLEEKDANGLFFVNGMYLDEAGAPVIEEVYQMGNVIGNHTQTHATLPEYDEDFQYQEISQTSIEVEEITGEAPKFFRAPHGAWTDYSLLVLDEYGMTNTNWSFGYDWMEEYQNPEALNDITLNSGLLGPGSNVLMHDREWTAAALADMIDGIRAQGLEIVDPKAIASDHELAEISNNAEPSHQDSAYEQTSNSETIDLLADQEESEVVQ